MPILASFYSQFTKCHTVRNNHLRARFCFSALESSFILSTVIPSSALIITTVEIHIDEEEQKMRNIAEKYNKDWKQQDCHSWNSPTPMRRVPFHRNVLYSKVYQKIIELLRTHFPFLQFFDSILCRDLFHFVPFRFCTIIVRSHGRLYVKSRSNACCSFGLGTTGTGLPCLVGAANINAKDLLYYSQHRCSCAIALSVAIAIAMRTVIVIRIINLIIRIRMSTNV